jgi:ComF family protein
MTLRGVADRLLSILLAPPCAVCNEVLERPLNGAVCASCWRSIHPQPCRFALHEIERACAIGEYESTLRDVIHALKYEGRRSIAPHLARLMAAHAGDVLAGADLLVPVPLHRRRLRHRGFNQAEDLANGVGLPVARVMKRVRFTQPQVDLPADKRRDNVTGAFIVSPARVATHVHGRVIVLIDDVATTGATLDACARALRQAGAAEVRALTAARVATGRR